MNEEKEKKAHEIAHKLTEEIVSNCQADETGMVISIIIKNLHNMHQTRIAGSEINLQTDQSAYTAFLNNIDLPLVEDKAE